MRNTLIIAGSIIVATSLIALGAGSCDPKSQERSNAPTTAMPTLAPSSVPTKTYDGCVKGMTTFRKNNNCPM